MVRFAAWPMASAGWTRRQLLPAGIGAVTAGAVAVWLRVWIGARRLQV